MTEDGEQRQKARIEWHEPFLRSLRTWSKSEHKWKDAGEEDDFTRPVTAGHWTEANDAFALAWTALMHHQASSTLRLLEAAVSVLQSPIEEAMFFALSIVGGKLSGAVYYRMQRQEYGERYWDFPALCIEPQAELGEYRVDFLVSATDFGPDFEHPVRVRSSNAPAGVEEVPNYKETTVHMIVECDGHDWHDRTKDQASRDRERDRYLQKLGYPVFRYTGADIWKDVFGCAQEAIETLLDSAHKKAWGRD
jgi:hypothetical protein